MKNTKKLYGIIATIVIIVTAFAVSGCVSTKVYDKSVLIEETAEIVVPMSVYITSINGERNRKFKTPNLGSLNLRIPAGQHNFVFHISHATQTRVFYATDLRITYNFLAGHKYAVSTDPLLYTFPSSLKIVITDITPGITDGILTVTGLDKYNGKYILFTGGQDKIVIGSRERQSDRLYGTIIENGIANIPVFNNYMSGYGPFTGNKTVRNLEFFIGNNEVFPFMVVIRGRPYTDGNQYIFNLIEFIDGKATIEFSTLRPKS